MQTIKYGSLGKVRQPNLRKTCNTWVRWTNNRLDFSSVCVGYQSLKTIMMGMLTKVVTVTSIALAISSPLRLGT